MTTPNYIVYIEKHMTGLIMRYGTYTTFHEASEALKYLKSINTIDNCYIDEARFRSGLNTGPIEN